MQGYGLNDTFEVDNVGDVVITRLPNWYEYGAARVISSVPWTLSNECGAGSLTLTGSEAISGKGNQFYNSIVGNSGSVTPCANAVITPPPPTSAITISDVAVMPCMEISVSFFIAGTMTKPPPTPSMPLRKPVNAPIPPMISAVGHVHATRPVLASTCTGA